MLPAIQESSWLQGDDSEELAARTTHNLALVITESLDEIVSKVQTQMPPEEIITGLCKDLSQSVAELSAKLGKLNLDNISDLTLECRKNLLDCATALTAALAKAKTDVTAEQKVLTGQVFPLLRKGCLQALKIVESIWMFDIVVSTGQPVMEMFNVLEKRQHKNLFLNVKLFGMRLAKFLELVVVKTRDIRSDVLKNNVIAQSDTLHKIIPSLIQSMTAEGESNALLLSIGKASSQKIIECFRNPPQDGQDTSKTGYFIEKIDQILKLLNERWGESAQTMNENFGKLQTLVDEIIQFAITINRLISDEDDGREVLNSCKHLVSEMTALKDEISKSPLNPDSVILARQVVADFVEMLEQSVNSGLLTLIASTFSAVHGPLDTFILHTSSGSNDHNPHLEALDVHNDLLFHIGHLSTLCTPDEKRAQRIRSSLCLMETLEKEMVPSVLRMANCNIQKPSPELKAVKDHLKMVRKLWKREVDSLEECLVEIVDPTAYCVVGQKLVQKVAARLKQSMYSQDIEYLKNLLMKVIKVSQSCVDFAWQVERHEGGQEVTDDHPVVKTERSIWEVKCGAKIILSNIEDLNAHKAMLKRVQVLITYLDHLVKYLLGKREDTAASAVKVLTSVSRVTIGRDGQMTVEEPKAKETVGKSFRNVSLHGNALATTNKHLHSQVNETLGRLANNATVTLPFTTRKNTSGQEEVAAAPLAVAEDFNLSQILNRLTTLSHELSVSLEQAKKEEDVGKKKPIATRSPLKPVNGRTPKVNSNRSRAKLEIEKYRSKVSDYISEKERANELEEMERKIAELLKA